MRLFRQGDEIPLETLDLDGGLLLGVNLVKARANPQENSPRTHWSKAAFVEPLTQFDHALDAVGLGQQASAVKGIDVKF